MEEYITTIAELKEKAIAELGLMTSGSYADFKAKAEKEASQHRVQHPKLIAGLIYRDERKNPVGAKEMPYPVSHLEWDVLVNQIEEYFESVPVVYVVDGSRFTAPI